MTTAIEYPHISIGNDGIVRLRKNPRFKVVHLAAEHFQYGWSGEEILRQHPDLEPGEVYSALAYFYDHRDELIEEIQRDSRRFEEVRPPQPFSKSLLKAREARLE